MSNTVEEGRPEWLAPLADPKSEMILRAAFDVFEEHGLHCATMLEVARRARVSKETLYARFDSKDGLFYALLAWGARQGGFAPPANDPKEDPVQALTDLAEALMTGFMRPESLAVYRMAISESGRSPEIGKNFDELSCQGSEESLRPIVQALTDAGLVEVTDHSEFYDSFMGLLRGNFHHTRLTGSRALPTAEEIARRARRSVELLIRAYAPSSCAHAIAAE